VVNITVLQFITARYGTYAGPLESGSHASTIFL